MKDNIKLWNGLPMSTRANYIRLAVALGLKSIDDIRNNYEEFVLLLSKRGNFFDDGSNLNIHKGYYYGADNEGNPAMLDENNNVVDVLNPGLYIGEAEVLAPRLTDELKNYIKLFKLNHNGMTPSEYLEYKIQEWNDYMHSLPSNIKGEQGLLPVFGPTEAAVALPIAMSTGALGGTTALLGKGIDAVTMPVYEAAVANPITASTLAAIPKSYFVADVADRRLLRGEHPIYGQGNTIWDKYVIPGFLDAIDATIGLGAVTKVPRMVEGAGTVLRGSVNKILDIVPLITTNKTVASVLGKVDFIRTPLQRLLMLRDIDNLIKGLHITKELGNLLRKIIEELKIEVPKDGRPRSTPRGIELEKDYFLQDKGFEARHELKHQTQNINNMDQSYPVGKVSNDYYGDVDWYRRLAEADADNFGLLGMRNWEDALIYDKMKRNEASINELQRLASFEKLPIPKNYIFKRDPLNFGFEKTHKIDSYLDAVNKGDMETALALRDLHFLNTGSSPITYYHGTNSDWTLFDPKRMTAGIYGKKIYLADDFDLAYNYANTENNVKELYTVNPQLRSNGIVTVDTPNQIKSADPVTYFKADDPEVLSGLFKAGDVIPLSMRDDFSRNDIRFGYIPPIISPFLNYMGFKYLNNNER